MATAFSDSSCELAVIEGETLCIYSFADLVGGIDEPSARLVLSAADEAAFPVYGLVTSFGKATTFSWVNRPEAPRGTPSLSWAPAALGPITTILTADLRLMLIEWVPALGLSPPLPYQLLPRGFSDRLRSAVFPGVMAWSQSSACNPATGVAPTEPQAFLALGGRGALCVLRLHRPVCSSDSPSRPLHLSFLSEAEVRPVTPHDAAALRAAAVSPAVAALSAAAGSSLVVSASWG
jgi:hypothetical protein